MSNIIYNLTYIFHYASISILIISTIIMAYTIFKNISILVKLIGLEVLTNLLMAGIALWALLTGQAVFIDICLAIALIMFLATVAYYQFLKMREEKNDTYR